MVRNVQGGSKSKSQGRKFSSNYVAKSAIRLSQDPLEQYACVIKVYGQGRCLIRTVDDAELQCVIRNKFRGRSKRNNVVGVSTVLLVGLREWEGPDNYKTCDVLEVYDAEDLNHLRSVPSTNVPRLDKYIQNDCGNATSVSSSASDELIFSMDATVDGNIRLKTAGNTKLSKINEGSDDDNSMDIDIDDI